jgi:hypothetical protein
MSRPFFTDEQKEFVYPRDNKQCQNCHIPLLSQTYYETRIKIPKWTSSIINGQIHHLLSMHALQLTTIFRMFIFNHKTFSGKEDRICQIAS